MGAEQMAMGANPYIAGAGLATNVVGSGIQAYLKWKEMEEQKKAQAALDFQNTRQNNMNVAEYRAGDPIGTAKMQNNMDYLAYIKAIKGMV